MMDSAGFMEQINLSNLSLLDGDGLDLAGTSTVGGNNKKGKVRKDYSGRSFLNQEDVVVNKQKLRGPSGNHLPREQRVKPIHLLDESPVKEEKQHHHHQQQQPILSNNIASAAQLYGEKLWKRITNRNSSQTSTAESTTSSNGGAQYMQRWKKVLKPGLKKGHWSPQEDKLLVASVQAQLEKKPKRINWSDVSKDIPKRSCKQCRERWVNHLNPEVNKSEWTPEEDVRLWDLQEKTPRKWAAIARQLPGRTENMVKVRWNILNREAKKKNGDVLKILQKAKSAPAVLDEDHAVDDGEPAPQRHAVKPEPINRRPQLHTASSDFAAVAHGGAGGMDDFSLPIFEENGNQIMRPPTGSEELNIDALDLLPLDFTQDFYDNGSSSTMAVSSAACSSSLQRTNSGGMGTFSADSSSSSSSPRAFSTVGSHVLRSSSTEPSYTTPSSPTATKSSFEEPPSYLRAPSSQEFPNSLTRSFKDSVMPSTYEESSKLLMISQLDDFNIDDVNQLF